MFRFRILSLCSAIGFAALLFGLYQQLWSESIGYEWDTSVVEYLKPDIPPRFQSRLTYQTDIDGDGALDGNVSVSGEDIYLTYHKLGWIQCVVAFDHDATFTRSMWNRVDDEHHDLNWGGQLPRPLHEAFRDGYQRAVSDLENLLHNTDAPTLRADLGVRKIRSRAHYFIKGLIAWVLATIGFYAWRRRSSKKKI